MMRTEHTMDNKMDEKVMNKVNEILKASGRRELGMKDSNIHHRSSLQSLSRNHRADTLPMLCDWSRLF